MKKFYAFVLMTVFAVSSAFAFSGMKTLNTLKVPRQIENLNLDLTQLDSRHQVKGVESMTVKSRADEPESFAGTYVQYFSDYFDLVDDNELYLQAANIEITPDPEAGEGHYLISNLFGMGRTLSPIKCQIVTEDGVTKMVVPAHQYMGEIPLSNGGKYYAFITDSKVVQKVDEDGNPVVDEDGNPELVKVDADEYEFIFDEDGFVPTQYFFGIYCYDNPEGETGGQGNWNLAWYEAFFQPNANFRAVENNLTPDGDIESSADVADDVYTEMYQDEDGNFFLEVSTISPCSDAPYYVLMMPIEDIEPTSDSQFEGTAMYAGQYTEMAGSTYGNYGLLNFDTWDYEFEGTVTLDAELIDDVNYISFNKMVINSPYGPLSDTGYWYAKMYSDAQVVSKATDGIKSVVNDNVVGAPEFYTIQGIKVNNPQPGNLYIVKQGSKVSKVLFR